MSGDNVVLQDFPVGACRLGVVAVGAAGLSRRRQLIAVRVHQHTRNFVQQRIRSGLVNLGQLVAGGLAQRGAKPCVRLAGAFMDAVNDDLPAVGKHFDLLLRVAVQRDELALGMLEWRGRLEKDRAAR